MAGFTPRVRKLGDGERDRLRLAQSLMRDGRLDEAESDLKALVAERPSNVPALVMMGRLLHKAKRPAEAAPILDQAVALAPMDLEPTLRAARVHLDLDNLDRAQALFATARNLDPHSAWARVGLGLVAARAERPDEALEHLEEAVRLDPGLVQARLSLARLLRGLEREDEATGHLRAVLERNPDHNQAATLLAQALLRQGTEAAQAEARRLLARAIDRAGDDRQALRQILRLTQRARLYAEGERVLRALLARSPKSSATRIRLIQVLVPQGADRAAEARALLAEIPRRRLLVPLLTWLEGDIALLEDRPDDAVAYYRAALLALPEGEAQAQRIDGEAQGLSGRARAERIRDTAAPLLRDWRGRQRDRRAGRGEADETATDGSDA